MCCFAHAQDAVSRGHDIGFARVFYSFLAFFCVRNVFRCCACLSGVIFMFIIDMLRRLRVRSCVRVNGKMGAAVVVAGWVGGLNLLAHTHCLHERARSCRIHLYGYASCRLDFIDYTFGFLHIGVNRMRYAKHRQWKFNFVLNDNNNYD